jgi:hypothetical protein
VTPRAQVIVVARNDQVVTNIVAKGQAASPRPLLFDFHLTKRYRLSNKI